MAPAAPSHLITAYGIYYLDNRPILVRAARLPSSNIQGSRWREAIAGVVQAGCNAVLVDQPEHESAATAASGDLPVLVAPVSTDEAATGPFRTSLDTIRGQLAATETEPLTAWDLPDAGTSESMVREIVAAVAHGAKGYAVRVDRASLTAATDPSASTRDDAIARLQEFLGTNEEEITASVEAQDQIAWLHYRPEDETPAAVSTQRLPAALLYPARALDGFAALLLTCGYNPVPLDLETVDETLLAEMPAALLGATERMDVDVYGKLVVFTLRGGSLVTFPQPPTRQLDGAPFRSKFLWPHLPSRLLYPGVTSFVGRLQQRIGRRSAPAGISLALAASGSVRGDVLLVEYPDAEEPVLRYGTGYQSHERKPGAVALRSQVLARHGRVPVAYRAQVRDGTSTVVGTLLAASYASAAYAALPAAERLALRRFAIGLFEDVVPRQIVPDDALEVETVARLSPDGGCLLFVVNRLGTQAGTLHFPAPEQLNLAESVQAKVLYTAGHSQARAVTGGVRLELAAGDAAIVRLR